MKVAVVGSRSLSISDLSLYLPNHTQEIISGGAKGIDSCAKSYAITHGILFTEFLPQYTQYGRSAPLKRNQEIVAHADMVIVFWDGQSRGSQFVIKECIRTQTPHIVHQLQKTPL